MLGIVVFVHKKPSTSLRNEAKRNSLLFKEYDMTRLVDCEIPTNITKEAIGSNKFNITKSKCLNIQINSKSTQLPSIDIQFENFPALFNLQLTMGTEEFWVNDCMSPIFTEEMTKCFNSKKLLEPKNSSLNALCNPDSVGTIDEYKVHFSDIKMDAKFCAIRNQQKASIDGRIGLNPFKSNGLLAQICRKYNLLPPIIGFFLRDSIFHSKSSISIGGYFESLTKKPPFFFHSTNPFHFSIQKVNMRNEFGHVVHEIAASSLQLTLEDFFIQGNPRDVEVLLSTCTFSILSKLELSFQIDEEKSLVFERGDIFGIPGISLPSICKENIRQNDQLKRGEWKFGKLFYTKYMQLFLHEIGYIGFTKI